MTNIFIVFYSQSDTGQLKASKTQQEREQMEQQSKLELPYPIQGSSRTGIYELLI